MNFLEALFAQLQSNQTPQQPQRLPPVVVEVPNADPVPVSVPAAQSPQQLTPLPTRDVRPMPMPGAAYAPPTALSAPRVAEAPRPAVPSPAPSAGQAPLLQQRGAASSPMPQPSQPNIATILSGFLRGAAQSTNPVGMLLGGVGGAMGAGDDVMRRNQTFQWLVSRGVPQQDAMMAVRSPEVMKQVLAQAMGGSAQGEFKQIGEDMYGNKTFGFVNERAGRVTPYSSGSPMAGGAPSVAGGASGGSNGMPAIPPGANPQEYLKAWSRERAQSDVKAQVNLPKAVDGAMATLDYIKQIKEDPNLGNVTGWQAWQPFQTVWGENRAIESRITQLEGRAFLDAFEGLKGGGQITEREGAAAAAALARLKDLKQDDQSYRTALNDFENEVRALVALAYRKAGQEPPPEFSNARSKGGAGTPQPSQQGGAANANDPMGLRSR